ncbi:ABC-F family ATP-binding cassette domain-containing protein [Bosea sp. (in: a-proteobacteria)]|uniref:ABC-F family ATP-binding cassette domain-containing protein n=1 Tax=Bosea sp. (in: a-proteobacteria) TaxID=1871050 RepID=UPI0012212EE0|nr:ABC-F family ATP-binding cassette domain-containing protein [Bosea sp. (in: a-proteobacteria)]TAJ30398.1 MAG: ABC-F family ATP-binding cassette domain-containing protein [Bosea sp. (in: a-proteobacteria)]
MPSITLSGLTWATPEGRSVFAGLDLGFGQERVGLIGRNGIGKSTLLKLIIGELRPLAGTIVVSGTVGVVRQTVQIDPRETIADVFDARGALAILRRAEAGDATLAELAEADWTLDERIVTALALHGVDAGPDVKLSELSGGQRTRVSLAAATLWKPDFLLLDEPTNNLDRDGREAVIALLAEWRAGAIVISHDRDLLGQMDAIVEMSSLGATRYGGNWDAYQARKAIELQAAQQDLAYAQKQAADAERKAQIATERQNRREGAGARKGTRGDLPRILLGARKNAAEARRGDAARRIERQRSEAQQAEAEARARVEILQHLSIVLPPTGLSPHRQVLKLDAVTAGYRADAPLIRDLSLLVSGPERLAVVGPNGSGKTTLLKLIAGEMPPIAGTVSVFVTLAMLDQRVSILDSQTSILDNFKRLNPGSDENACRAALAGFLFRADAALQTVGTLSGGQMLRAGLACILGGLRPPALLLLDEPTNHLDLASVEAIEAGLAAYDGALVAVSHDERFLARIGIHRQIELPGLLHKQA